MAGLAAFFTVEELSLSAPGVWRKVDQFLAGGAVEVRLVLVRQDSQHLYRLTLADEDATSRMMPYFHSERYNRLAVSIVDHIILEELLGLGGAAGEALGYSYDKQDAVQRVLNQEYQMAFLVSELGTFFETNDEVDLFKDQNFHQLQIAELPI